MKEPINTRLKVYWENSRSRMGRNSALLMLSLLGCITGFLVGLIVLAFRLCIEFSQARLLPGANPENYEMLVWYDRLLYATSGGVIVGLLFYSAAKAPIRIGIIHVMERLGYYEGHLPLKHAVMQFVGGVISIVSGHSVGREGPSIHLGATTASLLGQKLSLPNNSIRILVASGAAAGIAASFNTPLAGVIFAMEVIMMEYTIAGFTPVILAAVSATVVNRAVMHEASVFWVPSLQLSSIWELPFIIIMGIAIGALAAAFIVVLKRITSVAQKLPVWLRMSVAGFAVGLCGVLVPEVMGIGYDSVNKALLGELTITLLLLVLLFKFIATVISIGFNLPGGLIGPVLFMGALVGSATGLVLESVSGVGTSAAGFYAMLGMGAMMGATLQAPLAALLALLELTANPNIIFPGMLAIISANLAARELFNQQSVYLSQMQQIGLDYRNDPVAQSLRRLAVSSVMNTSFALTKATMLRTTLEKILQEQQPHWILIRREEGNLLLPAVDLAHYLQGLEPQDGETEEEIDLLELPAKRLQLKPVRQQATLQEAHRYITEGDAEALYVIRPIGAAADRIYGIITRQDIEEGYKTSHL